MTTRILEGHIQKGKEIVIIGQYRVPSLFYSSWDRTLEVGNEMKTRHSNARLPLHRRGDAPVFIAKWRRALVRRVSLYLCNQGRVILTRVSF
jgi:hypothetical protein